jgi:hypothetical protein
MAKLTNRQRKALADVLYDLRRVQRYLDAHAVCIKGGAATTTLHYTRQDGTVLYEVEKWIGSELAIFPTAIANLHNFLFTDSSPSTPCP